MKTGGKTVTRCMFGAVAIGLAALGGVQASSTGLHPRLREDAHQSGGSAVTGARHDSRPQADAAGAAHGRLQGEAALAASAETFQARHDPLDERTHAATHAPAEVSDVRGRRNSFESPSVLTADRAQASPPNQERTTFTPHAEQVSRATFVQTGTGEHRHPLPVGDEQHSNHGDGGIFQVISSPSQGDTLLPAGEDARRQVHNRDSATTDNLSFRLLANAGGPAWPGAAGESAQALRSLPLQSPVPEPETWAMLACGVLMVAWRSTRRRRTGPV